MGLITETNAQYYSGQQTFNGDGSTDTFLCTFNTDLTDINFTVTLDGVATTAFVRTKNQLVFNAAPGNNVIIQVTLDIVDIEDNYGSYEYIKLNEVINNFLVAYVGAGKLIPSVKRTDVIFHARRGLQEFSYDTLKSINGIEFEVPPSLGFPIPQDYVNYVKCSWIDDAGAKHILYPTAVTIRPTSVPVQDYPTGTPVQDQTGQNVESSQSITGERWDDRSLSTNNQPSDYREPRLGNRLGRRYGLEPSEAQVNGNFVIDNREGKFVFSSEIVGKIVVLEYVTDGLAYDADMKLPKMAEEAMYMHIAYSILAGRANVPEYLVQRFKKDRRAALRNAKLRLSNIKIEEIAQVMRNKSKWIKH
jgi:hypothetical protein